MGIKDKIRKLAPDLKAGIKGYPVTYAICVLAAVIGIWLVEMRWTDNALEPWLVRILNTLILGIPSSMAISAYFHHRSRHFRGEHFLWVAYALLMAVMFFWVYDYEKNSTMMRIGASLVFFIAIYVSVPAWHKKIKMEVFVIRLLKMAVINGFYVHVLYGGLSLITAALDRLFDLGIEGSVYGNIYIAVMGVVFSLLFLSDIRKDQETSLPKVFEKLNSYVLMPLLSAYSLVIYAYFIRILLTFSIPDNMIANMVLWYVLIGTGSLLVACSAEQENRFTLFFKKWFRVVMAVPLAMLFVSIGIRIAAYGITEGRYFTVAAGVWVVFVLLFSLNKRKVTLSASVALAAVVFIGAISPLNAFDVSVWSQNRQVQEIIRRNDMEQEGEIVRHEQIPEEEWFRLTDIAYYFSSYHSLDDLALPSAFIESELSMPFFGRPDKYSYINIMEIPVVLDVSGYSHLIQNQYRGEPQEYLAGSLRVVLGENHVVRMYEGNQLLYEKDLKEIVFAIHAEHAAGASNQFISLNAEQLTFNDENDYIRVRIMIMNAGLQMDDTRPTVQHMEYRMLFSRK
ncbi:MAG: DUF4153 domain-containing protein [Clostridia bacterium]